MPGYIVVNTTIGTQSMLQEAFLLQIDTFTPLLSRGLCRGSRGRVIGKNGCEAVRRALLNQRRERDRKIGALWLHLSFGEPLCPVASKHSHVIITCDDGAHQLCGKSEPDLSVKASSNPSICEFISVDQV